MILVCTVTNVEAVVYAGGSPESVSAKIEIPDDLIPNIVKDYFENARWAAEDKSRSNYRQLSFSLLKD